MAKSTSSKKQKSLARKKVSILTIKTWHAALRRLLTPGLESTSNHYSVTVAK